jgi:hypothetical protein
VESLYRYTLWLFTKKSEFLDKPRRLEAKDNFSKKVEMSSS